jgi:hypothetical protein
VTSPVPNNACKASTSPRPAASHRRVARSLIVAQTEQWGAYGGGPSPPSSPSRAVRGHCSTWCCRAIIASTSGR